MHWITFVCFSVSFCGLSVQHSFFEGYDLSHSGYHLCAENETTVTSKVLSYKISYIERRLCGGWLPWKMCQKTLFKTAYHTVHLNVTKETLRCCDGYEQVSSYCALPLNRSAEFSTKPGLCPRSPLGPGGPRCEWDTDCPGWLKCCKTGGFSYCTRAEADERKWCLNVTLTVKANFQALQFLDKGILNHIRLLHSMVTGALGSTSISVHHIYSQATGPLNTFSSLLLCSSQSLSTSHTAGQLQHLFQRIEEVLSIEVEDIDECSHGELNNCSPEADCVNTDGFYSCTCRPGFIDLSPNSTGTHCQASQSVNWTNTALPNVNSRDEYSVFPSSCNGTHNMTSVDTCNHIPGEGLHCHGCNTTATSNGTNTVLANSTQNHLISDPTERRNGTGSLLTHTNLSVTDGNAWITKQNGTFQVVGVHNMSLDWNSTAAPATQSAFHLSSSPNKNTSSDVSNTIHCPPVVNVLVSNVTSSTFSITWAVHASPGQSSPMEITPHTFQVMLLQESQVLTSSVVTVCYWVARNLDPGVLYTVRIVPSLCANHSTPAEEHVRTNAQALKVRTRLTNMQFNDTLLNSSSQDYHDFCQSFQSEIRRSLSRDILALLNSGAVKIRIEDLTRGSVVVNYVIVFRPEENLNIRNVSLTLLTSLQNSSKYIVDSSNSSIDDFDECFLRQMDCSPFALCVNTWGSFNCVCKEGFLDTNPNRPGRTCEAASSGSPALSTPNPAASFGNLTVSSWTTAASARNPSASSGSSAVWTQNPAASSGNSSVSLGSSAVSTQNPTASSGNSSVSQGSPGVSTQNPAASFGNSSVSQGSPGVSTQNPAASSGNSSVSPGGSAVSTQNPATSSESPQVTPQSSNSLSLVWDPANTGFVTVECRTNEIFVIVARHFLQVRSIPESSLYLGSPDCGVTGGNESHVQLNTTWDRCNTHFVYNSTHSTAEVILLSNMTSGFTVNSPKVYLKMPIMCTFGSKILISTGFAPVGFDMIKEIVEGLGTFHISFQLLNDSSPLPQNHTLSANEEVVIEIAINTTVPQIKLITNRCWATPSSNPLDTTSYEYLKNSCPVAGTFTTILQNGNSSRSRLSVRIFSTIEESVIYLHCQIQICVETTTDICKSDCRERAVRTANIVEMNRASYGPIYKSPNGPTNGNKRSFQDLGFIILGVMLCLLAILVALAVIFYYRNRTGRYSFRFKPKQEKFTYHIFDT